MSVVLPQGSFYYVRRLPAERRIGSVELSDLSILDSTDFVVLGAGPGKLDDNGKPQRMQAEPGHRVIVPPYHFELYAEERGFLADEHLVAISRNADPILPPSWEPANDWVMIRPDARERETVSAGGVVSVLNAIRGGQSRDLELVEQMFRELEAVQASAEFQAEPEYYQHRRIWDVLDAYPQAVRDEGWRREQAGQRRVTDWQKWQPLFYRDPVRSGVTVAWAPGKPHTVQTFIPFVVACMFGESTGARVRWGHCRTVRAAGFAFVRADDLECVEVEAAA